MGTIDDLLLDAMNAEVKAKLFYLDASKKAQSSAGKRFFREMADSEQEHYEHVESIIESRNEGIKLQLIQPQDMKKVRSEVEGEFEPNKNEIAEVLTLGIKAEQDACERYKKISEMINDPEGKEIFDTLAEDERRHKDNLEMQFYQISNKGTINWA